MEQELLEGILKTDFPSFIEKVFYTISPGNNYLPNWHIELIAEKLQEVQNGNIRRLIINVPPRSLKSITVSVAWPAWLLGHNPHTKIMAASYSKTLSHKHSKDCRLVVTSNWYRALFPKVKIIQGQNNQEKFVTTSQGFRFATSVGGTATGEGGDFLIVDDPHNPLQARSNKLREKALEWFENTFITRLNNKKKGAVVLVMQRLHPSDLTGHLLDKNKKLWDITNLPAIAEKKTFINIGEKLIIRETGDLLHLDREGVEEIERAKLELGTYSFAAQYQQSPILKEGTLIKLEWIKIYDSLPDEKILITQSWDTAIKTGSENDFSVCTTWAEGTNGYYLIEVIRKKLEYPALKKLIIEYADKWNAHTILIEDKASGQSLIQDIYKETKLPIIKIKPVQDKFTRFAAITSFFEAGKIFLPKNCSWKAEYEMELTSFPHCSHDDQVDSTSQFLNYIRNKNKRTINIRKI